MARLTHPLYWVAIAVVLPIELASQVNLETRLVQLRGRQVRAQVAGLDTRRPGSPVVIFEAGASNSLDVWGNILRTVAAEAPVIAYDRAGLGQSAWDSVTPTPRHVAERLRELLAQLRVAPPFILVGYSWGGILSRYFAGYHPDEIAGLVLIDPAPVITMSLAQHVAPFDSVGAGRAGFEAYWSGFASMLSRSGPAVRAEFEVYRNLLTTELAQRDLRPPPAVPMTLVVAAKYLSIQGMQLPYDAEAHFGVDLRQRTRELERWVLAAPRGTLVVSNTTTHAIPREDPGIVVWAVRRVLESVR